MRGVEAHECAEKANLLGLFPALIGDHNENFYLNKRFSI